MGRRAHKSERSACTLALHFGQNTPGLVEVEDNDVVADQGHGVLIPPVNLAMRREPVAIRGLVDAGRSSLAPGSG